MEAGRALTRYRQGSVRELLAISWPLILNAMSTYLMLFSDRLILSWYSTDAMNGVGATGTLYAAIQFTFLSIAMIAEVFVGQYNGAGQFRKIGNAVWQMIWFGLMSLPVFLIFGIFLAKPLIAKEYEVMAIPYFRIICIFGAISVINAALSSFFIGIGKPSVVTRAVVFGNLLNVVLDYFLILGFLNFTPMGTRGAAWATGIALCVQNGILFYLFLKKRNRKRYGTGRLAFRKKLFLKSLNVGWPNGMVHAIEIGAFAFLVQVMASIGDAHITVFIIGQNAFFLFCFFTEGISKGVTALVSNFIGARQIPLIHKTLKSALKFQLVLFSLVFIPMVIYPEKVAGLFIQANDTGASIETLFELSRSGLFWFWVVFVFDGMLWILYSILMAATDTKFLMWSVSLACWIIYVIPAILLVKVFGLSPKLMWQMMPSYFAFLVCLFFFRYKNKNWKSASI